MIGVFSNLSEGHNPTYVAGVTIALLYTSYRYIQARKHVVRHFQPYCIDRGTYTYAIPTKVNVPAMGPTVWLAFYFGTAKFLAKGQQLLREGVQKVVTYQILVSYRTLTGLTVPFSIKEIHSKSPTSVSGI